MDMGLTSSIAHFRHTCLAIAVVTRVNVLLETLLIIVVIEEIAMLAIILVVVDIVVEVLVSTIVVIDCSNRSISGRGIRNNNERDNNNS